MSRILVTLLLTFGFISYANAQDEEAARQQYLREQAMLKRMMLNRELDSGVYWMDQGEYKLADAKFRYVLANIQGVPSDLAFHFGKNSYFLGEYAQSVDWLSKDRKSTRLNSSHVKISYAVFCLKKK